MTKRALLDSGMFLNPIGSAPHQGSGPVNLDPSRAAPISGLSPAESGYSTVRYQGIWMYGESRASWLKRVDQALGSKGSCIRLYTVNPEIVAAALRDRSFQAVLCRGSWNVVDGVWLALAIAFRRRVMLKRNCGSDLIYDLLAGCQQHNRPVYFLGGKPERLEMALGAVRRMYPNLRCEGYSPSARAANANARRHLGAEATRSRRVGGRVPAPAWNAPAVECRNLYDLEPAPSSAV